MDISGKVKRQNIVTMRAGHPERFGRFIMALRNLIDSDDWPRICGIHGNTFAPGDKKVACPTDPATVTTIGETGEPFYCKHAVYSFIGWHTPYVYQFELLLNKYNRSKCNDYIALPWLDLTVDTEADYGFLESETIAIIYDKRRRVVSNPLAGAYYYVDGVKTPTTRGGFFKARNAAERLELRTVRKQLNNALYAGSYERFSSSPVSKSVAGVVVDYVPLETPHNHLHDIIGGDNGNMSQVNISAFDPVFWLHHCNMDRHFYTWMYMNSGGFRRSIYPERVGRDVWGASCAPFSSKYVYGADPFCHAYGWTNGSGKYMEMCEGLQLERYPYTYDIIVPRPFVPLTSFIELIDIPIPRESMKIMAYIHPLGLELDRVAHFAGVGVWFGVNQNVVSCGRCAVTRTNIKIDIAEAAAGLGLTAATLDNYVVVLEGVGRLISDNVGYKTYNVGEIIQDGSYKLVVK
jgi:hypothetical protein